MLNRIISSGSSSFLKFLKGPYKNSTFPPGTKSIKGLYTEEYILVVRKRRISISEYLRIPFAPLSSEVVSFYIRNF